MEFKKEAFILFEDMMARIDNETIRYLYNVQVQTWRARRAQVERRQKVAAVRGSR